MPTIILNRNTTNPNIPKVPVSGFFDDFDRPFAAGLGVTSREGKAWETLTAPSLLQIRDNKASLDPGYGTGNSLDVVESYSSDGTLTAIYSSLKSSSLRLAFRAADARNFYVLVPSQVSLEIRRYIDLQFTVVHSEPITATPEGKPISIEMSGTLIVVRVDGVEIFRTNDGHSALLKATKHGLQATYLASGATAIRVESIQFSAA